MKHSLLWIVAFFASSLGAQQDVPRPQGTPSPTVQFIIVDTNVKLEVVDWGGTGRPLIFLAGLGDTAQVFDHFAPRFTATNHVYGITRRGFGGSSKPTPINDNYSADRLGDDVLAVIDTLKVNRPILVGHSIAGEELSSIGSRYPEKIAGLIYLDAAQGYAYYDTSRGDLGIDLREMRNKMYQLLPLEDRPRELASLVHELLQTDIPQLENELKQWQRQLKAIQNQVKEVPENTSEDATSFTPEMQITSAILKGAEKYTAIRCPVLAIFAIPRLTAGEPPSQASEEAHYLALIEEEAKAFESGVPSAHVVRLPGANHYLFRSNAQDVQREMNEFLQRFP